MLINTISKSEIIYPNQRNPVSDTTLSLLKKIIKLINKETIVLNRKVIQRPQTVIVKRMISLFNSQEHHNNRTNFIPKNIWLFLHNPFTVEEEQEEQKEK